LPQTAALHTLLPSLEFRALARVSAAFLYPITWLCFQHDPHRGTEHACGASPNFLNGYFPRLVGMIPYAEQDLPPTATALVPCCLRMSWNPAWLTLLVFTCI